MNTPKIMPEEFLQYIWENRLFTHENQQTANGETLEIINVGKRNTDSGPDFFNARVKIDDTVWVGNIEIHRFASDWGRHNHNTDDAYNNVILHVAEVFDKPVYRNNGEEIPAMVLKYPAALKTNYQKLLDAKTWIACQSQFHKIDPIILQLGFNRLMIERLEEKTTEILNRLQQNNNDRRDASAHASSHNWNDQSPSVRAYDAKNASSCSIGPSAPATAASVTCRSRPATCSKAAARTSSIDAK